MATVFDVAAYILEKQGEMSAMKLQKLVYYCQAWSLVWDDKPIFESKIEAWANGPVAPDLYKIHKGQFTVTRAQIDGEPNNLDSDEVETVNIVLTYYGDKSPQWLSDLTHQEDPWMSAREGLRPGERGIVEISHASMVEYYGSLA